MEVILAIIAIYTICCFFEKSDYEKMKEAERISSFTKEESQRYYAELNSYENDAYV